jgi:hypothetical protein
MREMISFENPAANELIRLKCINSNFESMIALARDQCLASRSLLDHPYDRNCDTLVNRYGPPVWLLYTTELWVVHPRRAAMLLDSRFRIYPPIKSFAHAGHFFKNT